MDKKDYVDLVKEHIESDKILYNTQPEYRENVKALLEKKEKIIEQNGIFARSKIKLYQQKNSKIYSKIILFSRTATIYNICTTCFCFS